MITVFFYTSSWIYNYLCNQCLSPLMLWVWILLRQDVLNAILCDKVCQGHAAGRWFSPGTLDSSTNKTDCHNITEIFFGKWHKVPQTKSNKLTNYLNLFNFLKLPHTHWVAALSHLCPVSCPWVMCDTSPKKPINYYPIE
jgi:hypothetical protein